MDHTHCKKEKLIKITSEILCTRPEMPSASEQGMTTASQRKFTHCIHTSLFVIQKGTWSPDRRC